MLPTFCETANIYRLSQIRFEDDRIAFKESNTFV